MHWVQSAITAHRHSAATKLHSVRSTKFRRAVRDSTGIKSRGLRNSLGEKKEKRRHRHVVNSYGELPMRQLCRLREESNLRFPRRIFPTCCQNQRWGRRREGWKKRLEISSPTWTSCSMFARNNVLETLPRLEGVGINLSCKFREGEEEKARPPHTPYMHFNRVIKYFNVASFFRLSQRTLEMNTGRKEG